MDKQKIIRLGDAAQRLIDDEVVELAFGQVREEYLVRWLSSQPEQTALREECYLAMKVLDEFKRKLKVIADNGKFEKAQQAKQEGRNGNL